MRHSLARIVRSLFVVRAAAIVALAAAAGCSVLPGAYIDAGISVADSGVERYAFDSTGRSWGYSNQAMNPYGFVAIGYEVSISPRCSVGGAIRHESSLVENRDIGVNSLQAHGRCWLVARNAR